MAATFLCGIDPGAHGAVAIITDGGALLDVFDMPSVEVAVGKGKRTRIASGSLAVLLRRHAPAMVFVERVGPMPRDGSVQAFGMGKAAGIVEGVLAGVGLASTLITPVEWRKGVQLATATDKGASRLRAQQVWPLQADLFARVRDDGRAEAALIALYGLRTMQRAAA